MAQGNAAVAAFENDKFAMNKYSRQVGEFGVAAMAKLVQMKVLIIGLKGVGIEVAKNLILAGVGQVTLFDDDIVKISDLGTNFYLTELDVNKNKVAEASLPQLKSLNPLVTVNLHTGRLTNKDTKKYTMVVDCGLSAKEALICDQQCRRPSSNTKFIRSRVHGLVGYMFNDFGDKFTCVDKTGEQPISRVIDKIESDPNTPNELIVRLIAEKRHNIDFDGHVNFIKFDEIEGELGELLNNKEKPFEVKENKRIKTDGKEAFDPFSVRVIIPDLKLKDVMYTGSGQITQVKKAVDLKFKSLEESLVNPINPEEGMLAFTDGAKFGRPDQLHIALHGLWKYESKHKGLPPANDAESIKEIIKYAHDYNEAMKLKEGALSVTELDEDVVTKLAAYAECNFQPLCAFFGGIVAQEVVKYTGKYTPMNQWLHIDCFEVLPEVLVEETNEDIFKIADYDRLPIGSRYDDMIRILGKPVHDKLTKSSTFMVGCGALGCELLKNFALMGLACSDQGLITVTDNDQIEISNLSRQFLFREENVGQPKSLAAAKSVSRMNPEINVKSMENLVSPASEPIFNSDFWNSLDFVTNALDNVKARKYVDSQCVFYGKPLLESGTLGTKCNSQVIIPHMTASYSDGPDDDVGEAIPMCTLRNFPSQIEHCIEWSRGRFTDLFETDATKATNYMKNPDAFIKEMAAKKSDLSTVATELPSLQKVLHIVKTASDGETSFKTCVEEAYAEFHVSYRDKILSLIKAKPEDTLDEDKQPFWGKNRRFPQAAVFDTENETHVSFVLSMANILSLNYGVVSSNSELEQNPQVVKDIVATLAPPATSDEEVDLSDDENSKNKAAGKDELAEFEKVLEELKAFATSDSFKTAKVEPASFEKDDDSNFHIDFITASSNLRAWNYKMKEVSRHKCKMIAGRIIPAIATTTAAVTGLICIEMLKLIQPGKKLAAFKDTSNSLGVNMYQFMEPPPPIEEKKGYDVILLAEVLCLPEKFTKWDKTIIESKDKDLTLGEFFEQLKTVCKEKYEKDLTVTMLYHPNGDLKDVQGSGQKIFDDSGVGEDKLDVPLKQVIAQIYGESSLGRTSVPLKIVQEDEEGTLYKIPELVYVFA